MEAVVKKNPKKRPCKVSVVDAPFKKRNSAFRGVLNKKKKDLNRVLLEAMEMCGTHLQAYIINMCQQCAVTLTAGGGRQNVCTTALNRALLKKKQIKPAQAGTDIKVKAKPKVERLNPRVCFGFVHTTFIQQF